MAVADSGAPFAAGVPLLGDADVERLVPMADAIEALRAAFAEEAAGTGATMERTRILWDGGRLQAMGGYLARRGCAATKTWAVTPGGGQPVVVLFSLETGAILAIMESRYLSRLRTGAASGLATDLLAPPGASVCALVGTGRQAFAQAEALVAVRPIELIRVAARDAGRTRGFAATLEERLGVRAEAASGVAEATDGAPIVTAITNATMPVLNAAYLAPMAHVNGAGTILPAQCELATDVFAEASLVVVDSVEQASSEAGDLQAALSAGAVQKERLVSLADVVGGRVAWADGTTVFKSVGVGIEDVAVADAVWRAHVRRT